MNLAPYIGRFQDLPTIIRNNLVSESKHADKVFMYIFLANWVLVSLVTSLTYDTYMLGIVGGGLLTGVAYMIYKTNPGSSLSRLAIAVLIMGFPMIVIQQHLGRIEMHFHVFVILAFMTLYKDIMPIIASALTIAVHHLFFTFLQLSEASFMGAKIMLFNYGCGWDTVFLHAAFVVLEAIVLVYIVYSIITHYLASLQIMSALH